MFLPNYSMLTPFHSLVIENEFELFNKLVAKIDTQLFEKLVNEKQHFERIKEMFIYILENVYSYNLDAIEMFYCRIELDLDDCDEDKQVLDNCEITKKWLHLIRDEIFKDEKFKNHKELSQTFDVL